jgi:hypothetical protein
MQLLGFLADRGHAKKGDVFQIRASNEVFGGLEPSYLFMVEVPGIPMAGYLQYEAWRHKELEIVSSDLVTDTFRVRIGLSPGEHTNAQITAYIESWNGSVVSLVPDQLEFDISIADALMSHRFWNAAGQLTVSSIVFSELSYNQGTGVHRIEADYSALGNSPTWVEEYAVEKGVIVVSHDSRVLVFDATRPLVREIFESDIGRFASRTMVERRYYLPSGVVDAIIAQGGTVTTDEATLMSYMRDKADG